MQLNGYWFINIGKSGREVQNQNRKGLAYVTFPRF